MKKVFTVGVFDYFHLGHLRLFKQAREHGDYLTVAIQDSEDITRTKPNATQFYSTAERIELILALKIVDEVIVYRDVDTVLKQVEFDVFAVGEDQDHEGFRRAIRWCAENGKEVVRLKRTAGISSSDIKTRIEKLD